MYIFESTNYNNYTLIMFVNINSVIFFESLYWYWTYFWLVRLIKHCLPLLNELNQSGGLREILQGNLAFLPKIFSKILISKINPKFKFFHFFILKNQVQTAVHLTDSCQGGWPWSPPPCFRAQFLARPEGANIHRHFYIVFKEFPW